MTIHQLAFTCWEMTNPGGGEDQRHFDDQVQADIALAEILAGNPESKASVHLLDAPCWVIESDGECGQLLDEEDEGYVFHHATQAAAEETAAAWGWVLKPSPHFAGWLAYCPCGLPEGMGAAAPGPSPAEQEAAGQMRLPGVST